jgi:hypothetical protein
MDPVIVEYHLAQAERRVKKGQEHVAQQRRLLAELDRNGRDTTHFRALLGEYEDALAIQIADRDRLRNKLSDVGQQFRCASLSTHLHLRFTF